MSFSSNSRTAEAGAGHPAGDAASASVSAPTRRQWLAALAVAGLAGSAAASALPSTVAGLGGLRRWGSGEFRRFGLLVYEASLWAGDDPLRPPLALRLDYRRRIRGPAIADASVQEMRRFARDEAMLREAGEQMRRIFPDVQSGEHLLGVHRGDGAQFFQNDRALGTIVLPGFADAFFAIWLDPRTSEPDLRAALLRRPGS